MSFLEQYLNFCVVISIKYSIKAISQVCIPMKSQLIKNGMATANLNEMKSWQQILPQGLRGPELDLTS